MNWCPGILVEEFEDEFLTEDLLKVQVEQNPHSNPSYVKDENVDEEILPAHRELNLEAPTSQGKANK